MKSISLYVQKDSLIHRIDPISKLFYIFAAIVLPAIAPSKIAAFICIAVSILLLVMGKVFRKVIPLASFSLIVLLSVVIIQGLFKLDNKTPVFNVGSLVFYKEGLVYASGICINVLNILFSFAILVLTTKPSDLIESLVRKGLSPKIGYVLSSVLQIIPDMTATMSTITDAQKSRGLETEGKLSTRIKAFIPLIGPVVMNSLVATRERAMALEVRGFNARIKKSFLNEEFNSSFGKGIRWSLIIIVILVVVWRIAA